MNGYGVFRIQGKTIYSAVHPSIEIAHKSFQTAIIDHFNRQHAVHGISSASYSI